MRSGARSSRSLWSRVDFFPDDMATPVPSGDLVGLPPSQDCVPCSSGHYCGTTGLSSPSAPCYGGFFCKRGVGGPSPTSGTYMLGGIEHGGGQCPAGTYCPNGTDTPLPCEAGTYNGLEGQEDCPVCPAGFFCEANATQYGTNPCPPG